MVAIVDTHVHCRDGAQYKKDTIARVSYHAGRNGVGLIMDMPNTDPALTSRKLIEDRLELARATCVEGVTYGLHIGVTADPEQIREAVECYNELGLRHGGRVGVVGLKMFAGKSTGDLAIIGEEKQRRVYSELARQGYKGVLVVHAEKENFMRTWLWNPERPVTHSLARPAVAELESVKDQIEFAYEAGFKGNLHIAHVSTTEAADYIATVKSNYGCRNVQNMKISCGVTPHHLFVNTDHMDRLESYGTIWKVNPPVRDKGEQEGLVGRLKSGRIDLIETDHANHMLGEKLGLVADEEGNQIFMSGIPTVHLWPMVIKRLKREGFTDHQVGMLTSKNALEIYGLPVEAVGDADVAEDKSVADYQYDYRMAI